MNNTDKLAQTQAFAFGIRPATHGFPYLAEAMRLAGVRKNAFDVASGGAVYVMDGGNVYQPGPVLLTAPADIPAYNQEALVAAIDADKAGRSEFPEFLRAIWDAGVVRFEVDLTARTCTYLSASGEHYVETYPAVSVELPQNLR